MLSKAEAKKIMLAMKGASEAPYFGKPAIFYAENFVGRVHDKEEAVAMAKEFMQLHLDFMPGWEGTCELRAFAGP